MLVAYLCFVFHSRVCHVHQHMVSCITLWSYLFVLIHICALSHSCWYVQAVSNQPVLATMHAAELAAQHYTGGVYTQASCSSNKVDHAVVIVGFDVGECPSSKDGSPDLTSGACTNGYWIVRNSWGTDWGDGVNSHIHNQAVRRINAWDCYS